MTGNDQEKVHSLSFWGRKEALQLTVPSPGGNSHRPTGKAKGRTRRLRKIKNGLQTPERREVLRGGVGRDEGY